MSNNEESKNKIQNHDDIFNQYKEIIESLNDINDSNEKNIIINCKRKLNKLIQSERKDLKSLTSKISDNYLKKIEKNISIYLDKISNLEQEITGSKNNELDRLLLEANQLYKQLENQYILRKFEKVNQRLDDKIIEAENSTTSIMFNVISIFLGISITSAMISGIEYISSEFIVFYFFSCAWIALTIITISALYLKKPDIKSIVIIIIYFLFTIAWITIGLISYKNYEVVQNDQINTKEVYSNSNVNE